jgi:hypothetical protein
VRASHPRGSADRLPQRSSVTDSFLVARLPAASVATTVNLAFTRFLS